MAGGLTVVTAVTLTSEIGEHGQVWRLVWTEVRGGRDAGTWTKSHDTEQAARRHVKGLLAKRLPGTTVADVFSDARSGLLK